MGYNWTNSSWKRMDAIGRQEIAYSKLTRARSKCFKDEGCDENDYVFLEINLPCSISYSCYVSYSCYGVDKFLFCGVMGQRNHSLFVNVPHQVINHDRTHVLVVQHLFLAILVFILHDGDPWNNNCASLRDTNHHTFGFLENNSYVFDGSLFSSLGDHCVKFQEKIVEHFQYVLTSLDTYVKNLVEQILADKTLMVVNGLLEHLWHGLKLLFVEISFKTVFERAFCFKFFLVHYKKFLLSKEFET
ncbi:hypothetical protein M9H77_31723 [Catharanthus roseus]|uniref:Uncharacterized protein n=1 Tax=Catharanthus roseus TaxID=4058 RepID=A0ACC0A192_CATRO|nr:hypothetical protein M9H77_31723 [Catharanthus roseus]